MAQLNVTSPSLPLAPEEYNRQYMDRFANVMRLFFNQIVSPGPMAGATQRNGTEVISGLSFAQPDPTTPGAFVVSLPTEADLGNLRVGSVYYDSATNVLKIKV
jgi:hypothetical protein